MLLTEVARSERARGEDATEPQTALDGAYNPAPGSGLGPLQSAPIVMCAGYILYYGGYGLRECLRLPATVGGRPCAGAGAAARGSCRTAQFFRRHTDSWMLSHAVRLLVPRVHVTGTDTVVARLSGRP
jgi:hypothetical protein